MVFEDMELTCGELNEAANQVARRLQAVGVKPDTRVGLCVHRSLEMVAGLLGILKAGGAYVPLDPAYPREWLDFMLKDSRAAVLLTQATLRDRFKPQVPGLKLLCVDGAGHASRAAHPGSAPRRQSPEPKPDNLAYVLYTSGSTGTPNGVMVPHRNVVNFLTGTDRVLGKRSGVWLAVTSISLDISVLELFWTLARGFQVVIQPDDDRAATAIHGGRRPTDGQWRSLPEQILRHGVTHCSALPPWREPWFSRRNRRRPCEGSTPWCWAGRRCPFPRPSRCAVSCAATASPAPVQADFTEREMRSIFSYCAKVMTPPIPFSPPPRTMEPTDGEVHVFCAWLDLPASRLEQLAETLSGDERARAGRFAFARDRDRFLAGRGLLREILGRLLRVEPAQLVFAYGDHGKPRLAGPVAGRFMHFNLAHSGALGVYAVSARHEVGVDVERLRPVAEAGRIVANYFSEGERKYWLSLAERERTEFFFSCWTRKEALLKATGDGIGESLNQLDVRSASGGPPQFFHFAGGPHAARRWVLHSCSPAVDYLGAIAVEGGPATAVWWRWASSRQPNT
ncbi:MAG: AMP-binding protein [Verrucomicrobiota bacterium]|nr:AMP-binding protein [Verrucomicrobiota bacterium]